MLQYGQTEDESRITAGSSGYADFSDVSSPQNGGADSGNMPQEEQQQGIVTPRGSAEEEPRVLQFTNKIFGDVEDEKKKSEEDEEKAAPYMVSFLDNYM